MTTPKEVRADLIGSLALDLIGPDPEHASANEALSMAPSRWYLTGFLVPYEASDDQKLLAVDEPIYRRLPCFLIATVDKFAGLPWIGESGALLGKVDRFDKEGFYGARSAHSVH